MYTCLLRATMPGAAGVKAVYSAAKPYTVKFQAVEIPVNYAFRFSGLVTALRAENKGKVKVRPQISNSYS
jgi:hypothetical protein